MFGVLIGLVLLAYGTLSLLMNRIGARDGALRSFCWAVPYPAKPAAAAQRSISDATTALIGDPASAYRWADMAEAQLNSNEVDGAKTSFRKALAAGPGSPAILFRAACFYLRLEDYPETLSKLTAILRNPDLSDYYSKVFTIYRQMDLPLEEILNKYIPHNEAAATGFLSFWIQGNQKDEAGETWLWLKQNSLVDVDAAAEYVSFLVKQRMYADAVQIWAEFNAKSDPDFLRKNWIFNGSFESDPADCPFDWIITSNNEVTASIESGVNYGGLDSLKLTFSGSRKNNFRAIYQDVVLNPGSWTLRGYMKTSHMTADQGVFFRIVDAEDASRLDLSTNGFESTQDWSGQEKTFTVTPSTRLVRIELISPKSKNPAGEIAGSVWVDHIELTPAH